MTEQTGVLLVDDHPVVRQGLRSLLSQYPDIQVIGEAEDSQTALALAGQLQPHVILLDIRLAGSSGLDLARQLRRVQAKARVIILTSFDDEGYLLQAAQAGAYGYLLKSASPEVLADAIRAVHRGERRLSPDLAGKAFQHLEALSQAQVHTGAGFTDQELELLQLIADGETTQDIAQALYLSQRTVKRKIQDVLTKLGAANRPQAVAEAFKRGLI